jgi:hypothetical protein
MLFNRFLAGPLMDDEPAPGNGGNPAVPAQPSVPAFDPTVFRTELRTELLTELRKDLNGIDKKFNKQFEGFNTGFGSFKNDLLEMLKPKSDPTPDPNPAPEPGAPPVQPPVQPKPAAPDPAQLAAQRELKDLRERMTALTQEAEKAKLDAAKKELQSNLRSEISKHQFATPKAQNDLFNLLSGSVTRGEDGNYYGPDGVLLEEYVRSEYAERPHWHPTKPVNGSGAGPSQPAGGNQVFDMSNIRPGMSKEEKERARQIISQFS